MPNHQKVIVCKDMNCMKLEFITTASINMFSILHFMCVKVYTCLCVCMMVGSCVCLCGGMWVEARGWKYIYQLLFDLFSRKIHLATLIGQQALEILLATASWYWDYRCEPLHARFLCRFWGLKSGVTLITDWLGYLCDSVLYFTSGPSHHCEFSEERLRLFFQEEYLLAGITWERMKIFV